MPSTTAKAWPTVAELTATTITNCMGDDDGPHIQIVRLREALESLLNLDVAPSVSRPPEAELLTLETVGALTSTLAKLRFDLEYALGEVREMELMRDAMALEVEVS